MFKVEIRIQKDDLEAKSYGYSHSCKDETFYVEVSSDGIEAAKKYISEIPKEEVPVVEAKKPKK